MSKEISLTKEDIRKFEFFDSVELEELSHALQMRVTEQVSEMYYFPKYWMDCYDIDKVDRACLRIRENISLINVINSVIRLRCAPPLDSDGASSDLSF